MDDGEDNSKTALQIVFVLSLLLVSMDVLELYFSYYSLAEYSTKFGPIIFEQCFKYHILTQMFFTVFATLAGLSAFIFSIGLLIDTNFFAAKLLDIFMYYNFYSFGPFLLSATLIGFANFGRVSYNCDGRDLSRQYLNFSTAICILMAFLTSFFITIGYTVVNAFDFFNASIRFVPEGNYLLGKIFWKYVFRRANESLGINQDVEQEQHRRDLELELNEVDNNNNNNDHHD